METPAAAQAPHRETRIIAERDGEIVLLSSFICHFLSLLNKCLPAIASQRPPRGLQLDILSFNGE